MNGRYSGLIAVLVTTALGLYAYRSGAFGRFWDAVNGSRTVRKAASS